MIRVPKHPELHPLFDDDAVYLNRRQRRALEREMRRDEFRKKLEKNREIKRLR